MKKQLRLEIKQNLKKPPRVYVKSTDLKTTYGSFHVNGVDEFDGWDKLSTQQAVELRQFMQNVSAVYEHLKPSPTNMLTDFRFRLPVEFVELLEKLEIICFNEGVDINIFESIITTIVQQLKVATNKLDGNAKIQALELLTKANLAEYKKQDFSGQTQAIFAELQAVYNRSEKLHKKSISLFDKDKSYSPLAIRGMANGETTPAKWLIACAIDVLIDEQGEAISKMLSQDDIYMLWALPIFKAQNNKKYLLSQAEQLNDHGQVCMKINALN